MATKVKQPALMLYTGDWKKDPGLTMCSAATRGIWVDLLCAMHDEDRCGKVAGTVAQLARVARCSEPEMSAAIDELSRTKTADVTLCHENVTLINRRMFREFRERKSSHERQKRRRGGDTSRDCHADVTEMLRPYSSSSSSISSSDIPPNPLLDDFKIPFLIPLPRSLDTPEFGAAWQDWLRYTVNRTGGKASQDTLTRQLTKLATYGPSKAAALLDEAITQGWGGPVWPESKHGASKQPQPIPQL